MVHEAGSAKVVTQSSLPCCTHPQTSSCSIRPQRKKARSMNTQKFLTIRAEDGRGNYWDYPIWFEPRYEVTLVNDPAPLRGFPVQGTNILRITHELKEVVIHLGDGPTAYQIDQDFIRTCRNYREDPKFCIDKQGRNHRGHPVYVSRKHMLESALFGVAVHGMNFRTTNYALR